MSWLRKKPIADDYKDDKYFDADDDQQVNPKAIPTNQANIDEEEIDPLDAFMQGVNADLEKEKAQPKQKKNEERIIYEDPIDPMETYLDNLKKKLIAEHDRNKQKDSGDDEFDNNDNKKNYEFLDSDGEINFEAIKQQKKKKIEPLANIDHQNVKYEPFNKDFYEEHEEIANLTPDQVKQLRSDLVIKVRGPNPPNPIVSFGHLNLDSKINKRIVKQGFEKPTPIQSQAIPAALSGRDVIGIAKTGSGKTLAYIWPMIIHILDQREVKQKEGPIGVVICPTRELSQQVYVEASKYTNVYNIKISAILGGESKREQWKELRSGVDILIGTPGRIIDMVRLKALNFARCTFVVLDEADKMFSMGFEYQIRSIIKQIRPDRQTLMFSATFKKKIQNLALDILMDPVIINIGKDTSANEDIEQKAFIFENENRKFIWLMQNVNKFLPTGKVLVFVNTIEGCNELEKELSKLLKQTKILVMHGNKEQYERTEIIQKFKNDNDARLLIATDVASRGLDVPAIKFVINYQCPKDGETHIHRVGRTGRAGDKTGKAFSLVTKNEAKFAAILCSNFELSGQEIIPQLEEIAMNDPQYRKKKTTAIFSNSQKGKSGSKASKLLQNAFKRGQKTTTGLGFKDSKDKQQMQNQQTEQFQRQMEQMRSLQEQNQLIQAQKLIFSNMSGDKETEEKIQAQMEQMNQQIELQKMKQKIMVMEQSQDNFDDRDKILSEYANQFKTQMQVQFRSNFQSGGEVKTFHQLPTIQFKKKTDEEAFLKNMTTSKNAENQQKKQSRSRSRSNSRSKRHHHKSHRHHHHRH